MNVSAKKGDRKIEVQYDFGYSLEEAVALFGNDPVFAHYQAQAKISLQANLRRLFEAGKTDKEIVEFVSTWKPGATVARVPSTKKYMNYFMGLDAEARQKLLEELITKSEEVEE